MSTSSVPYMATFPGGANHKQRKGKYYAFLSDEDLTEFIATAVSSGTAAIADDVAGGGLVLSGAATTDDSGSNVQLDCTPIKLTAGKSARFMARITLSDAIQSDLWAGFGPVDTSVIAGVTDFCGFKKADGSAALVAYYERDDGTPDTLAVATLVDATEFTIALETSVDTAGNGRTAFFFNGKSVGVIVHTTSHMGENFNTPTIAFQSGDATGTKTCTVHELGFDWDQ